MTGFDCHAHCFPPGPFTPYARYKPDYQAHLSEWLSHLEAAGLEGGVLVQPSFLADNHRTILTALANLGSSFRGVADFGEPVEKRVLRDFAAMGVAGIRWNLIGRELPRLSDPRVAEELSCLKSLGMHLQVHLEAARLPNLLANLPRDMAPIVIDHFGRPGTDDPYSDPAIRAIISAHHDGAEIWVKMSAPYRASSSAIDRHAAALLKALGPTQFVWGSDWPWTQHENAFRYEQTLNWLYGWVPNEADAKAILEDNPRRLYRMALGCSSPVLRG